MLTEFFLFNHSKILESFTFRDSKPNVIFFSCAVRMSILSLLTQLAVCGYSAISCQSRSEVGTILGKGGSKVKEIEQSCGAVVSPRC